MPLFRGFTPSFFIACISFLLGCQAEQNAGSDDACLNEPQSYDCPVGGLNNWLATPASERPKFRDQLFAQQSLDKAAANSFTRQLFNHHSRQLLQQYDQQWQDRVLQYNGLSMPFFFQRFGNADKGTRSLFISMHGGGGAPAEVNDGQYVNQQHLYDATMNQLEGIYLAPRAPSDASDMWYKDHIDEFFNLIIQLAVINEGVDPNRVYLMGYSAGGDGVYQLAPRMANRWAAAAMMAGHPNASDPYSLANMPFTIHVGDNDTGYDRNLRAQEWGDKLDVLESAHSGLYSHSVKLHRGLPHWMELEDSVALPWMHNFTRNPIPPQIHWQQTTQRRSQFYWLSIPYDLTRDKQPVTVEYNSQSNTVNIIDNYASELSIWLNDDMLDLDENVVVQYQGDVIFDGLVSRRLFNIYESLGHFGDINTTYSVRLNVLENSTVVVQ